MFERVAPLPAVCSCVRGAHWVVRRGALVCCPLGLRAGPRAAQNLLPCAAGRVAPHFLGRFCSQAQKTQALNLFFAYVCSDDAKTTSFLSPAFRPARACGEEKKSERKKVFFADELARASPFLTWTARRPVPHLLLRFCSQAHQTKALRVFYEHKRQKLLQIHLFGWRRRLTLAALLGNPFPKEPQWCHPYLKDPAYRT